ncbi:MAG: hypothetical protein AAGF83_02400 [Cyanobacteria bacterium P01_G01_bin.67]
MKQNYWNQKPRSFANTVELVERYVLREIKQEIKQKGLRYHNLDHALAVKRRAKTIFDAIKPVLAQDHSSKELQRLESLIDLCALAHDMVQLFDSAISADQPRKHIAGASETETANKLLKYIHCLNQELKTYNLDSAVLFNDYDQQIIRDAIAATVCKSDPQAGKVSHTFSIHSIYQPYLYESGAKISVVGSIIALADLGTLGIDGIDKYIQDGILVFLENNPDYEQLIEKLISDGYFQVGQEYDHYSFAADSKIKARLLTMTKFMINFAHERKARFELEISGFAPLAQQILRNQIFVHLSQETIDKIETIIPSQENVSLEELVNFFRVSKG